MSTTEETIFQPLPDLPDYEESSEIVWPYFSVAAIVCFVIILLILHCVVREYRRGVMSLV